MPAAYTKRPQRGRTLVSVGQAAKTLRKDPRTIRAMIADGRIEGVCQEAGARQRWWVYADQLEDRRSGGTSDVAARITADNGRLVEENMDLRARLAKSEETNRSLLGAQAMLMDALRSYRSGSEQVVAAQSALEGALGSQREATVSFQKSAHQFAEAFSVIRDLVAANATPDDIRDLTIDHQV